ncbi:MAG: hypothetical protein ABGY10_01975 [bacterium]
MEGTPWGELGIAGILIVIVLREVFNFLRSRNGNGHSTATAWALESSREFGSMTTEMRKLNHSIAQLSQTLNCLSHEAKATRAQVKEVRKDIEELDRRMSQ